jgi:hypothetical protein
MKYTIQFTTTHPYCPPGPSMGPDKNLEGNLSIDVEASSSKLAEVFAVTHVELMRKTMGSLRFAYQISDRSGKVVARQEAPESELERVYRNVSQVR